MSEFLKKYEARKRALQASHTGPSQVQGNPTYEEGDSSPFVEAMGYQMKRGLTGAGNILLRTLRQSGKAEAAGAGQIESQGSFSDPLEGFGPFDTSARAEDKEIFHSGGLANEPGAGVGSFVGGAVTVPPMARGPVAAAKAPSLFSKVLGRQAGARAAEGAAGTAMHGEGTTGEAAGGAALSLALGRGADAARRVGGGLVRKSEDAQQLELMLRQAGEDAHIPLSLSADKADFPSRLVGGTYRYGSPFFLMAGDALEDQREKALKSVRLAGWRESAPGNMKITADDLDNPDLLISKVHKEFDRLYDDTVKSYAFNIPSDLDSTLTSLVRRERPNIDSTTLSNGLKDVSETLKRFSDGKAEITGDNLLFAKQLIGEQMRASKRHEKDVYKAALSWIDGHIADELKVGNVPQNLEDLMTYERLSPAWRSFRAVVDSTRGSRGGSFSPEQLARRAKPLTPERELARTADRVLGQKASSFGPGSRMATGLATAGMGVGMGLSLPATALAIGGGRAAVSESAQRAITGDTAVQSWLRKSIKDLNEAGVETRELPRYLRRGVSAQYGEE